MDIRPCPFVLFGYTNVTKSSSWVTFNIIIIIINTVFVYAINLAIKLFRGAVQFK